MLRNKRIRGILVASVVYLCAIIHSAQCAIVTYVRFDGESVSCNLSGTYTRELHQDGTVTWSPSEPSDGSIRVSGCATGIGNAAVELASGTLAGNNIPSGKSGKSIGTAETVLLAPYLPVWEVETKCIGISYRITSLSTADGPHSWAATGRFYTQPVRFANLSWSNLPESYYTIDGKGEWTIQTKRVCHSARNMSTASLSTKSRAYQNRLGGTEALGRYTAGLKGAAKSIGPVQKHQSTVSILPVSESAGAAAAPAVPTVAAPAQPPVPPSAITVAAAPLAAPVVAATPASAVKSAITVSMAAGPPVDTRTRQPVPQATATSDVGAAAATMKPLAGHRLPPSSDVETVVVGVAA